MIFNAIYIGVPYPRIRYSSGEGGGSTIQQNYFGLEDNEGLLVFDESRKGGFSFYFDEDIIEETALAAHDDTSSYFVERDGSLMLVIPDVEDLIII